MKRIELRTEYQREQFEYVDSLMDSYMRGYYKELDDKLMEIDMGFFYRALLEHVKFNITGQPFISNVNNVSFYLYREYLKKTCYFYGMKSISDEQIENKIYILCDLGLINKTGDDIYELVDPAPLVIKEATKKIKNIFLI